MNIILSNYLTRIFVLHETETLLAIISLVFNDARRTQPGWPL